MAVSERKLNVGAVSSSKSRLRCLPLIMCQTSLYTTMFKTRVSSLFAFALLIGLLALSVGCHPRFKKFVGEADAVEVAVDVQASPRVELVQSSGTPAQTREQAVIDLASTAVGAAESVRVRKRIRRMLNHSELNEMVAEGVRTQLDGGPPLAAAGHPSAGDSEADGTLQISVTDYGIDASQGEPVFLVDYRVRIYRSGDGKRVYKNGVRCRDRSFFRMRGPRNLVSTAAIVAFFESMSDEELESRITDTFRTCTSRLVTQMRKHAG